MAQRYTLSHLAHDVKKVGIGEPTRDWFPISFMSTFSDWSDLAHGPGHDWGQLSCGCHPNCGVGMAVMVDKETKEAAPITQFLDAHQMARDTAMIVDAGRGQKWSAFGMALAFLRNYDPFQTTTHFTMFDMLKKLDKTFGVTKKAKSGAYGKVGGDRTLEDIEKRRKDRWNVLMVAGMWFQDLWNYDFRRTEQCIIPYATQEGEISFCAYNTGVGWRNIVEKMHMTAMLTKWYEEQDVMRSSQVASAFHGAGNERHLELLQLKDELVTETEQQDLDKLGIAKNAREENSVHATPSRNSPGRGSQEPRDDEALSRSGSGREDAGRVRSADHAGRSVERQRQWQWFQAGARRRSCRSSRRLGAILLSE